MSFHIQPVYMNDNQRHYMLEVIKAIKPPGVVVLDSFSYAMQVKPYVKYCVYRDIALGDDNNVSLDPSSNAQAWLDAHAQAGNAGLWLYAENESGTSEQTLQWLYDVLLGCIHRRWRVVIGNYAVGNPGELEWYKFNKILRLMAENPDLCMFGLHEYFASAPFSEKYPTATHPNQWSGLHYSTTEKPYINGRYRWYIAHCKSIGIKPPKIFLTEFGSDEVPALYHIQRNYPGYAYAQGFPKAFPMYRNFAPEIDVNLYAYKAMKDIWDKIYYHDTDVIAGVAIFTASNSVWHDFDLFDTNLIELIKQNNPFRFKPTMEDYKITNEGTQLQIVRFKFADTLTSVRVRLKPSTSHAILGLIKDGNEFSIYTDSRATDNLNNFQWRKIIYNGQEGWFAMVDGLEYEVLNGFDLKAEVRKIIAISNNILLNVAD